MGGNSDEIANFSKFLGRFDKFFVQILWDMALCGWMNSPRYLEGFGTCETSQTFSPINTVSRTRRPRASASLLWEPRMSQFDNSCSGAIRYHVLSLILLRTKLPERLVVLRSSVSLFNSVLEYRTACQKTFFLHLLWKIFLLWMRCLFRDFGFCSKQKFLNAWFQASAAK
jgi:hypothetical protein